MTLTIQPVLITDTQLSADIIRTAEEGRYLVKFRLAGLEVALSEWLVIGGEATFNTDGYGSRYSATITGILAGHPEFAADLKRALVAS